MKLAPYPSQILRLEKSVRHFFSHHERWWAVVPVELAAWSGEWQVVRGGRAFEPEGWLLLVEGSEAHQTALRGYDRMHAVAERACDEARERGTVYPTEERHKVCYVGRGGVNVIVAAEKALVTVFRPAAAPSQRRRQGERAADVKAIERASKRGLGVVDRRAVRNASRRASLFGEEENSHGPH